MLGWITRRVKQVGLCTRGNIAIIFGLTAPFVIAITGVAVDYGGWLNQRTKMQNVADAAALAAARLYSETQNAAAAAQQANAVLDAHDLEQVTRTTRLVDGDEAYEVTLRQPGKQYFSGLLSSRPPVIGVSAKASISTGPGPCILTLDPHATKTLWLDSNARMNVLGCNVHANSGNSQGMYAGSNSRLDAELSCVVGGYGGSTSHYNPEPVTGCAPVRDPMAHIPEPIFGGCSFNGHELDDATTTLKPGVYCGGLTIKGNSNVTFSPGTYVIKNGRFVVDSNSRVTGTGVTFYLTGSNATIEFTSNTVVNFSAPTSGPQAGVIFFEDRNAPLNREHYSTATTSVGLKAPSICRAVCSGLTVTATSRPIRPLPPSSPTASSSIPMRA